MGTFFFSPPPSKLKLFIVGVKSSNKETHSGPAALTFGSSVSRNPNFKVAHSKIPEEGGR